MAKASKAKIAANNRYTSKAYDRLNIVIPKGKKEAVEAYASSKGQSVNGLVNELIRENMGLTLEEWKGKAGEDEPRVKPE